MSQLPVSFEGHHDYLFQRVLELTDDAVLILSHQHMVVYANPAATKIFGKETKQIVGKDVGSLPPEDRRHTFERTIDSLTTSTNHSTSLQGDHEFIGLRANQHAPHAHGKLTKLVNTFPTD